MSSYQVAWSSYQVACKIVKKLQSKGFIAYFSGGWVRDFIMNHPSDDIDIATNATVEDLQNLFPKTIPVGINFGIIIVVEEGHHFEVAIFRRDRDYMDGRRPTSIEPATPEEDAERRDFTINGMFYDPIKEELYDYVKGQEDIKKKIIRAIGDPHERFLEDRLRMIRAIRYAGRFHFTIEKDTKEAIYAHAGDLFPAVAIERVWQEFTKMANFSNFERALEMLHEFDLLKTIFPSLKETPTDDIRHRLKLLPRFPKETPVIAQLLELFPSSTHEEKISLCETLKLSNKDRDFVTFYDRLQKTTELSLKVEEQIEDYDWAHLYASTHFPLCLSLISLHQPPGEEEALVQKHEMKQEELKKGILRIQNKDPLLKAEDLIKAGITPGIKMGLLLKEGERLSINEAIDCKTTLLKRLQDTSHWTQE